MNKATKTIVNWIIGISMFIALGIAGGMDQREAIKGSISYELYQKILHNLGGSASDREICSEYQENKEAYDALGI